MAEAGRIGQIMAYIRTLSKKDIRYNSLNVYLGEIKRNPESNPYDSIDTACWVVERLADSGYEGSFSGLLDECEEIYRQIIPWGEKTENFPLLRAVFLRLLEKDGIYFRGLYSESIFRCFKSPENYLNVMTGLMGVRGIEKCFDTLIWTALEARGYFTREEQFAAWVHQAAVELSAAEDRDFVKGELISRAMRCAGIYDIDEEAVDRAEQCVRETGQMLEEIRESLKAVEMRTETFTALADRLEKEIKKAALLCEDKLRMETTDCSIKIKSAFEEILSSEQKGLQLDRDRLLGEIFDSADSKIRELKMVAESIRSSTANELYRINTQADKAVERAAAMLSSGELGEIIRDLKLNEELVEKIVRVEKFSRKFDMEDGEAAEESISPRGSTSGILQSVQQSQQLGQPVTAQSADRNAELYGGEADETVCFSFNESVPFDERINQLMAKKLRLEAEGEIFHGRFDDVLTAVIEDSNPYLIGPSGCGKTYLIGQISELLGLPCLDVGYINEEYDLIGFQTASGGYNYPAFYRAYKFGGIVFCDEFDNSNSRAAVKLNSFMTGGKNASYCFPNGELVKRHPNFRIIAAGNTAGSGADRNYSTREKIEESVAQRFTAMYVSYDNRLEQQILSEYPEWFGFGCAFRIATDAYSRVNDISAPGIFTTRDAASIKKYLDHKSFGSAQILEYEFIETKENDYLAFLKKELEKIYEPKESGEEIPGRELFEIFSERVSQLLESGGVR